MTVDAAELELLSDTLRKTMTSLSGAGLDEVLIGLGWPELLADSPEIAIPTVFSLLGETGSHAPLLNDVVLAATGRPVGGTIALPYAGRTWVRWERTQQTSTAIDPDLPLYRTDAGPADLDVPVASGRMALGWWLTGSAKAMLSLARTHALDRVQFGKPIAGFQAVRHRLAETLVAIEGAEATLSQATSGPGGPGGADDPELAALLAKAAAGNAALTAAKHCQQVLGGIGFTEEHEFHRHYKRVMILDGLLGSARELTREAGALVRERGTAPRLAHL